MRWRNVCRNGSGKGNLLASANLANALPCSQIYIAECSNLVVQEPQKCRKFGNAKVTKTYVTM